MSKILIFTVSAWNSKVGANTWATLLEGYDSKNIANICIREEIPDSKVCSRYFSISENNILKSVFKRNIKTGKEVEPTVQMDSEEDLAIHNQRYAKYRKKRPYVMLLARELAWKLGKWKTKELDAFLDDFKPDIILHSMEGYIHLNRIVEYAIKRTGAKAIGYIWDDNFTYKQSSAVGYKLYRYFQRKSLKSLAKHTQAFFAITPKTKREADAFFAINSIVLTKPLNAVAEASNYQNTISPIKFLYTGNLLIGRDRSLLTIVDALKTLGKTGSEVKIDVYTQTPLEEGELRLFSGDICQIHSAISQQEVIQKQKEADVLLFLEDVDGKDSRVARLSFSTKITDYLSSGKCIFAVGNSDLAPIEYLKDNEAALVACSQSEVEEKLRLLLSDNAILQKYANGAVDCGRKNHSPALISQRFRDVVEGVLTQGNK